MKLNSNGSKTTQIKVLDCTLRDGGYYNQWDFPSALVSPYLQAMSTARVNMIEIGFRLPPQNSFVGAFAYSTDEFLKSLPLPKNVDIAVMVDAKDMLQYPTGPRMAISTLFAEAKESPVKMVRVAVHSSLAMECAEILKQLKDLGYYTALNLMQVSGETDERLREIARSISQWQTVDVLYFADSLGNLTPDRVSEIVDSLRSEWKGSMGIHTHDNMGQALNNSLKAIECGVEWIDGTVLGMGRGAGNMRIEHLLLELKNHQIGDYYPDAVYPIVIDDFEELKKQYGWGPNLLYYLSGSYGIHPTYVQEMLKNARHRTHHIISALDFLRDSGDAKAYRREKFLEAIRNLRGAYEGSWSAKGWVQDKTVIILGSGPKLKHYTDALVRFIDKTKPVVISSNINRVIPADRISAYAACHKSRLLMDVEQYRSLNKPIIAPMRAIPDVVRSKFEGIQVLDYGMLIEENSFSISPTGCTIPESLAAAYSIAFCTVGGAKRILLAGFDGFGTQDFRQHEMERVFRLYSELETAVPIQAITPTSYAIERSSIYSPAL